MPVKNELPSVGLIVDDFLLENAGIPRYCAQLYSGLQEEGLAVQWVTTRGPRIPFGDACNHTIRMPSHILRSTGHLDILHATSPITALAFPFVKKTKVVTFHDFFSILGRRRGVTAHVSLCLPLVYRVVARHSDGVIAHSTQTKAELVKNLHLTEDKITVVNSGIEDRFRPLPRKRSEQEYTVGYVGTLLSSRKRLDYLLRAFCTLRRRHRNLPARLVLCGQNGSQALGLLQLAEDLGVLEEVVFAGSVPDDELVQMYNCFDVLVLPSDWEGFGFTILEAQRCGVPVIIRADAHIPAEVSRCCLKASSEEDMADKIYELLTSERLRQTMIDEGLEYSQQFTWDRTVQQTISVYEELLSHR